MPASLKKTLLVLRHAEAGHSFSGEDHTRTLTERGHQQARGVGENLARQGIAPEAAVVSDAMRTRQTYVWIAEQLGDVAPTPYLDDRLYLAHSATMCSILNETPETVHSLLVVAHMPGVQELSMALASAESDERAVLSMAEQWPTAGLAQFAISGPWAELDGRDAELLSFIRPVA